jgi:hypothetical protein
MKLKTLPAAAILGLALVGTSLAATANPAPAHKHEHGAAPGKLQLNAGKKWETDQALRQAMGNIRQTMAASLPGIHQNRFAKKDYAALAQKIEAEVGSIVANCKLSPKADEQLHLIVADLMEGAEQMAGKSGKGRDGAVRVVGALDKYANYFDDPGFVPIKH